MAKVFISHSRLDGWLVKPIGKVLKEIGVEPYIAEIETPEAKPLPVKFQEHIQTSNVMILLLTANVMKNTNTRDVVNWEVATAHAFDKPVYVFREKGVELKAIMNRIRKIAQILKDNEDTVKVIVTAIAVGLGILLLAYVLYRAT